MALLERFVCFFCELDDSKMTVMSRLGESAEFFPVLETAPT